MRYAIKVNHFSFRLVLLQHRRRRRRLPRVLSALSLSSPPFTHTHLQRGNLAPAATVSQPACTPATSPGTSTLSLSPFWLWICLLSSLFSFLFFFALCPLGTFNFWRSFVVIFLDMRYSILCTVRSMRKCVCKSVCLCACVCVCVYMRRSLLVGLTVCCWYLARLASIYVLFAFIVDSYLFSPPLSSLPHSSPPLPSSFYSCFCCFFIPLFLKGLFFGCGSHLLLLLYW